MIEHINRKELLNLIKRYEGVPDRRFNKYSLTKDQFYRLNDGRLIEKYQSGRGGAVYLSADEALTTFAGAYTPLIIEKSFVNNISRYISSLRKYLKLSDKVLDFSISSLKDIDSAYHDSSIIFPDEDIELPLTAYVGEVIIKLKQGKWKMVENQDTKFEPIIETTEGSVYYPRHIVSEELNGGNPFCLSAGFSLVIKPTQTKWLKLFRKK